MCLKAVRMILNSMFAHCAIIHERTLVTGRLLQNRVSDNVGGVKHFSRTLQRALGEERHFALVEWFAFSNPGSLVISLRSGTRSDPCISSVSNCDHDYYFELLHEEERDAQSITRCLTAHHRDFRAVPRANRT